MKHASVSLIWALSAMLLVSLACGGLATTPTVSNIRMTTDDTGETPTNSYLPGDDFYVFADLAGVQVGSVVQARWFAVDAEGVEANSEINTSDYSYESGISYVYFQLGTSDGSDWPPGTYRVELFLDGTKVGEKGFSVQ